MEESADTTNNIGIYDHVYKGTNKINIKEAFSEYQNFIKKTVFNDYYLHKSKANMMKCIGPNIDLEKFDLLDDYCDPKHFTVYGELETLTKTSFEWCKDTLDTSVFTDLNLRTIYYAEKRNKLKSYQKNSKYKSEKPIQYEASDKTDEIPRLLPFNDILIFIRVYIPFTHKSKQISNALRKVSVNYVISIAGSQTLDKLRDKISCVSDLSISKETSKKPIKVFTENAKNVYKSGFFFIEDTFYNDFRDPANKDNSAVIREWAKAKNLGNYKTARMENTRVDTLALRFGFPWVYQHQGDCEHLLVFSDAALVNPTDELALECYPRLERIKPKHSRYCMTCGIYSVNWITTNNTRVPHNPCYFCDSCFKSYNYIDGKKIGDFEAYAYPFDSDLLKTPCVLNSNLQSERFCLTSKEAEEAEAMQEEPNDSSSE